jgi:hypothetical protein
MVAFVSVLTQIDAFFNWRVKWRLMEETQFKLNRLRDEVDFLLVTRHRFLRARIRATPATRPGGQQKVRTRSGFIGETDRSCSSP